MKSKPFDRVKIGDLYRDIDGNLLMKIPKAQGSEDTFNSVILIPNKKDLERGSLVAKNREAYCEVLIKSEVADVKLDAGIDVDEPILTEDVTGE